MTTLNVFKERRDSDGSETFVRNIHGAEDEKGGENKSCSNNYNLYIDPMDIGI